MAETLTLGPAPDPEAPFDAAAIRSRFEQLLRWRREEEEDSEASAADLCSEYKVALEEVDSWDSSVSALGSGDLDEYMKWLRKELSLVEEENLKLSVQIVDLGETVTKDMIQLNADIEALKSSLKPIDSEGPQFSEPSPTVGLLASTISCGYQVNEVKDYKYEVLELDYQIEKGEMDLRLLENLHSSLKRVETIGQLESMLSESKVLDFRDNCLRLFLKAPTLTSDCVIYGQKLDCAVDLLISDHELLIEVNEGSMELKKVQIFPGDVCIDRLVEKIKSEREVISAPSLGWFIRQVQHHIIINTLRQSLVNDANKSRHSFEYFEKDEAVVVHLVGGIDAFIKLSVEWPLSSYGLKLISIRSSGMQPTNISLNLLCKTKELANGLELHTRRHLVRFVDAVEEILVREMQSELHSGGSSGKNASQSLS